jgi:release factor glutamine methyltransferase
MPKQGRSSLLSGPSPSPLPPCGGARSRSSRERRGVNGATTFCMEPPSLSLPHKGGGESSLRASHSIQDAFVAAASVLRQAGIKTPELDARLLLCHAAGLSHEAYVARAREALAPEVAASFEASVLRRAAREPVSRILGSREFYGREFLVDRHALDPRPDTETLIEAALDLVARAASRGRPLKLLDLGTGTGCILITLLAELPHARGVGTDISGAALKLAAANAGRLGVADRARFVAADWLDGVEGCFDLILSNPPYIASAEIATLAREVADHDPRLALDGGPDGLDAYRRIAASAGQVLAPTGRILVEIGSGQAEAVARIFRGAGLSLDPEGSVGRDFAGRPRLVVAREQSVAGQKRDLENHDVRIMFMGAE